MYWYIDELIIYNQQLSWALMLRSYLTLLHACIELLTEDLGWCIYPVFLILVLSRYLLCCITHGVGCVCASRRSGLSSRPRHPFDSEAVGVSVSGAHCHGSSASNLARAWDEGPNILPPPTGRVVRHPPLRRAPPDGWACVHARTHARTTDRRERVGTPPNLAVPRGRQALPTDRGGRTV